MLLFEGYICWILTMEYFYDKEKDEVKRQRKTRTTKKTTTDSTGQSIIEEQTDIIESKPTDEK